MMKDEKGCYGALKRLQPFSFFGSKLLALEAQNFGVVNLRNQIPKYVDFGGCTPQNA
jgi:hypothetical protein